MIRVYEEWRIIDDYPVYAVSNIGRVKRVIPDPKGRLRKTCLKGTITSKGYVQVGLWRDGVQVVAMVHRLVCEAFHGAAPSTRHIVAHGDGNPLNNTLGNLRWATHQENENDKRLHGTLARGERQGAAKLSSADVLLIRKDKRPQRTIAKEYGVTQANISSIVRKKSWMHI